MSYEPNLPGLDCAMGSTQVFSFQIWPIYDMPLWLLTVRGFWASNFQSQRHWKRYKMQFFYSTNPAHFVASEPRDWKEPNWNKRENSNHPNKTTCFISENLLKSCNHGISLLVSSTLINHNKLLSSLFVILIVNLFSSSVLKTSFEQICESPSDSLKFFFKNQMLWNFVWNFKWNGN